jgi:hypothetical protein
MTSQKALLWTSEQPQQPHPSEYYEAGVTGTFVCGWGTFFTETAFFAEAFLRTGPFGVLFFAVAAANISSQLFWIWPNAPFAWLRSSHVPRRSRYALVCCCEGWHWLKRAASAFQL